MILMTRIRRQKHFQSRIPNKDVSKYKALNVSLRGMDGAYPGIVKVIVANQKNEQAIYYIQNVRYAVAEGKHSF